MKMHEAALAESILNIVLSQMRKTPDAELALTVQVSIGEFRNVDFDSLQFAFDNIKPMVAGCERCELNLEAISAQATCRENQHAYHASFAQGFRCPICDSGIGTLTSGEEFAVTGMTLQAR